MDDKSDITDICALIEQQIEQQDATAIYDAVYNDAVYSEDGSVNDDWCNNIADAIDAALALEGGIDAVFPHWDDNSSSLNYILMGVISIGGEEALDSVIDGFDSSVTNSITDHLGLNNQSEIYGLLEQQAVAEAVDAVYSLAGAINDAVALGGGLDAVFPNYSDDRNFSNSTIY